MFFAVLVGIGLFVLVVWFCFGESDEVRTAERKETLAKVVDELVTCSSAMRGQIKEMESDAIGFWINYNPVVYDGRVGRGVKWLAVYYMDQTGEGVGAAKRAGMEVMPAEKDGLVYYKYVVRHEVTKPELEAVYKEFAAKYQAQYPHDLITKEQDGHLTVYRCDKQLDRSILMAMLNRPGKS